ncbi:hypothetical protein RFI_31863, partial [Reticulomyxa filosa]
MLKQLVCQKLTDLTKQEYYEKQIQELSNELEDAHVSNCLCVCKKAAMFEEEKSKLNPDNIEKFQFAQLKIQVYENKIKLLTQQLTECRLEVRKTGANKNTASNAPRKPIENEQNESE